MVLGNFDYYQSFVDIANIRFVAHFDYISVFFDCFKLQIEYV